MQQIDKTETSGALTYEALVRFSKIAFRQSTRMASVLDRELAEGTTRAEKYIVTPHGVVWLSAENWQAIADVMEKIAWPN